MGQIQSFDEFLNLLFRRRWLILAVTVLGVMAAVLLAKSRANIYESAAVIQVEVPVVTDSATGQSQSGSAQLLQVIQQRLTTRENLLAMIDRHQLFADAPALSDDDRVFTLRQAISFQSVASAAQPSGGGGSAVSAIIIAVRLGNPDQTPMSERRVWLYA